MLGEAFHIPKKRASKPDNYKKNVSKSEDPE